MSSSSWTRRHFLGAAGMAVAAGSLKPTAFGQQGGEHRDATSVVECIPFSDALKDADVLLSSISDGQAESLMLGNGDLYGIVWERDGGLFMRITKNDIWDARVDTSNDPDLPHVDMETREVSGGTGAPPSYAKLYPQPRCATGLRLGPSLSNDALQWRCIRTAPQFALNPMEDGTGAEMSVGGEALDSTGYQVQLPDNPVAASMQFTINGSENAEYYADVFGPAGEKIFNTGWTPSPRVEQQIELEFRPVQVGAVVLYTRTLDGAEAENLFGGVCLRNDDEEIVLKFQTASSRNARLDVAKAVATIESDRGETTQVRILHDGNVVLVRSCEPVLLEPIFADTLPDAVLGETDGVSWLRMEMPGDDDYEGMVYAAGVAAQGDWKVVSLVTSFDVNGGDPLQHAIDLAKSTIRHEADSLISRHEEAWGRFWSRSGVDLADSELQRLWYRMLYFAKTVCKPGAAPVALMPPLASDATPWHADYHHNYNAWQAFWPLPAANHPELADPWISYIDEMLPRFQWLARQRYDLEGAVFPISSFLHEPDPTQCTSNNNRQVGMNPWGMTIGMGGMSVQSMWQKHLCEPDPEYLREKIYPTLREVAKFYVGYMEKCKRDSQGSVVLGPSYSPEHGPMGINNCPFDIGYVRYTFNALIQASEELGVDQDLAAQCRTYKDLMGDYPTALNGDGEPVIVDWDGCGYKQVPQHNIEVPASPVFPCDQVTWFSSEAEKELFRRTIRDTTRTGNNSHIMFNIAKARLSMPEAVADAKAWAVPRTLPNGFIQFPWAHGTFMQEMIGLVGLINEFLLQSVDNKIRVFPCWPKDQDARFAGLRAQGGFLVAAEQKSGQVVKLEVISTVGGSLQLLSPWDRIAVNGEAVTTVEQGLVTLETEPGETLTFRKI
jgi:hypothetical protein